MKKPPEVFPGRNYKLCDWEVEVGLKRTGKRVVCSFTR